MFSYRKVFDGYQMENVFEGLGGTVYYTEKGGRLPFEWGTSKAVPCCVSPCPSNGTTSVERHGLPSGKGRRLEILGRVGEYVIMWYGSGLLDRLLRRKIEGDYEIGDNSLTVYYRSA